MFEKTEIAKVRDTSKCIINTTVAKITEMDQKMEQKTIPNHSPKTKHAQIENLLAGNIWVQ